MVKPIPDRFHSITPYLRIRGAARAIEFYKKAFGAEESFRMQGPAPDTVGHAELLIGNSVIMLSDEWPDQGCPGPESLKGTSVSLHLYVEDADAAHKKALSAGARELMAPADMFWGDRMAKVADPFGHEWSIATHKEDLTHEQIGKRAREFMSKAAPPEKK